MESVVYREMTIGEAEQINDIDASQYIRKAWREVEGERVLIDLDYNDPTWPNGYEDHLKGLKKTIQDGGKAFGAYGKDGSLLGFATVNREIFGECFSYVLLDQMFISRSERGKGIGKSLFNLCAEEARTWRADKLYICAGSAEDTIAFYRRVGCVDAVEVNREFYESDPRDMQLEYSL